jgi:hypothetical protein
VTARFTKAITGIAAGVMLSGAALLGTAATAAAATPTAPVLAPTAAVQPAFPPHNCSGRKHWRNRWHDNHGWHNAGCW